MPSDRQGENVDGLMPSAGIPNLKKELFGCRRPPPRGGRSIQEKLLQLISSIHHGYRRSRDLILFASPRQMRCAAACTATDIQLTLDLAARRLDRRDTMAA